MSTYANQLRQLLAELSILEARIDKGTAVLAQATEYYDHNDTRLLVIESRYFQLIREREKRVVEFDHAWDVSGLTIEWVFPADAAIAVVAGKWKRQLDGTLVARFTYAEMKVALSSVGDLHETI